MEIGDFIEHHGIKGQKWGVRRKNPSKSSHQTLVKDAKSKSDEDLKKTVERLRLEKEFVSISKNLDAKPAKEFIARFGNQAVSVAIGAATSAAVGAVIKKVIKSK